MDTMQAIGQSGDMLQATMAGLDAGLKVLHITTLNPLCCSPGDACEAILKDSRLRDFDHIPVKDGERFVGVIARCDGRDGRVRDVMRPLDDSVLVSADEALSRFLPNLADMPFRLVVLGTRIQGIVTRSDVLKLPVRLLAFTLITHLEMVMAELIRLKHPNDDGWIQYVESERRKRVQYKFEMLRKHKLDPSLLECTDFRDKRMAVAGLCQLDDSFLAESERVEYLRNAIAHAADYGQTEEKLLDFLRVLQWARHCIDVLSEKRAMMRGATGA